MSTHFEKCKGAEFLLGTWGLGFPTIVHPRFLLETTYPASARQNHSSLKGLQRKNERGYRLKANHFSS